MSKRFVAILITVLLIATVVFYFACQLDWQKFGLVEYSLGAVSLPTFSPPARVTLLAVGDIMLDRGVEQVVNNKAEGDFNFVFNNIRELKDGSDILMGNLEGPVALGGIDGGSPYSFHVAPEVIPVLKSVGFDLLNVANNHAGDWGREAFVETLDNLDKNKIAYVGGARSYASATEPVIIEKNDLKIGFLGFSDVGPLGMLAKEKTPGIVLATDLNFGQIIKKAAANVDVLVVTVHWGDEYKLVHNRRQEEIARQAILAGAKVVIGHHPHVVQDSERYETGYVAYSLGNFVFDQYFSPETMEGLVLKLELSKKGVIGVEKRTIKLNDSFQPSFVGSSTNLLNIKK